MESHEATPILAQPERKVTIYSTKNGAKNAITTNATTWGELKDVIRREVKIDPDKFLATETVSKTTYEVSEIALPVSSFFLIIRPKDTKAGAKEVSAYPLNRTELMASLKEAFTANPKLKEKFSGNMSQTKTPELEAFHKKHIAGKSIAPAKATSKATKKAPVAKKTAPKKEVAPKKVESKTSAVKKTTASKAAVKPAAKVTAKPAPKKATTKSNGIGDVVKDVAAAKNKTSEGPSPEDLKKADELETKELAQISKSFFGNRY